MVRQVVLDTETTGIDFKSGHRVIEIGCVEIIDRNITDNNYHQYICPNRKISEDAIKIHGLKITFIGKVSVG